MEEFLIPSVARFVIILSRMAGLFYSAPFFSSSSFNIRAKTLFSFIATLLFFPVLPIPPYPSSAGLALFLAVCGLEMAVGLLMGLMLNFVFAGIQLGGEIMGFEIGYSMIQSIDPTTMIQTNLLAVFWNLIAMALFLVLNAHHLVVGLLVRSYEIVPVGGLVFRQRGIDFLISHSTEVFLIGIRLAAPILVVMVVIDVVVGLMGRAAPSLNIMVVGFPLKLLVGLFTLGFSLLFFPGFFDAAIRHAVQAVEKVLGLMSGASIF